MSSTVAAPDRPIVVAPTRSKGNDLRAIRLPA